MDFKRYKVTDKEQREIISSISPGMKIIVNDEIRTIDEIIYCQYSGDGYVLEGCKYCPGRIKLKGQSAEGFCHCNTGEVFFKIIEEKDFLKEEEFEL